MILAITFFLVIVTGCPGADPNYAHHAVVQIPSHGGSGVVVRTETTQERSFILTAAHLFIETDSRGRSLRDFRQKPIRLMVPTPKRNAPSKKVGVHLVAIDVEKDLALLEVNLGKLPYVAPVAPPGHSATGKLLSVGYDEMRRPPQVRSARIVGTYGNTTFTDTAPWHGRSGGALIDPKTGYTIGIVSGYESLGPPNGPPRPGRGIYVSLGAIHQFLRNAGKPKRPTIPPPIPHYPACPGGICPLR